MSSGVIGSSSLYFVCGWGWTLWHRMLCHSPPVTQNVLLSQPPTDTECLVTALLWHRMSWVVTAPLWHRMPWVVTAPLWHRMSWVVTAPLWHRMPWVVTAPLWHRMPGVVTAPLWHRMPWVVTAPHWHRMPWVVTTTHWHRMPWVVTAPLWHIMPCHSPPLTQNAWSCHSPPLTQNALSCHSPSLTQNALSQPPTLCLDCDSPTQFLDSMETDDGCHSAPAPSSETSTASCSITSVTRLNFFQEEGSSQDSGVGLEKVSMYAACIGGSVAIAAQNQRQHLRDCFRIDCLLPIDAWQRTVSFWLFFVLFWVLYQAHCVTLSVVPGGLC